MSKLRMALEEALVENPEDRAAHAAYADLLTEEGDPRGEFIAVQLELEEPSCVGKKRKQLQKREEELQSAHEREWLGGLAEHFLSASSVGAFGIAYEFVRGWLDSLHIVRMTVPLARALVGAPETRLLRRLTVEDVASEAEQDEFEPGDDVPPSDDAEFVWRISLHPLARSPYLKNVRVFQLGQHPEDLIGEAAATVIAQMPRIEEIRLSTRGVDLDHLFRQKTFQNLRVLQVHHMTFTHPLKRLAANPSLKSLTHLMLHPQYLDEDEDDAQNPETMCLPRPEVRALLRSKNLPALVHLQLRNCSLGDPLCHEIVQSGILKRLKVLDLRYGYIMDEGARELAECPDLTNLQRLDIDRNFLTPAGVTLLRATGILVQGDDQRSPDEMEDEDIYEDDWE